MSEFEAYAGPVRLDVGYTYTVVAVASASGTESVAVGRYSVVDCGDEATVQRCCQLQVRDERREIVYSISIALVFYISRRRSSAAARCAMRGERDNI
jgi:hypothetical protein